MPRSRRGRRSPPSDRAAEGVAGRGLSLLVAAREPAAPLLARPVGPRLGVHLPLRLLLDPVVADRRRGVEALVDVLLRQIDDQPRLLCVVRPHAGIAVGLQLRPDRAALGPLRVVADPTQNALLVLDVVAVFVRDHVRLRERAVRGAELRLEVVEEVEVDVDLLVARAVERPDLRACVAATGLDGAGEEDGVDELVLLPVALEDAVPELLHAVDDGDDAAVLPLVRILPGLAVLVDAARRLLPDLLVVERREPAREAAASAERLEQDEDDEPDDAEPAAAERHPPAAAHAAAA